MRERERVVLRVVLLNNEHTMSAKNNRHKDVSKGRQQRGATNREPDPVLDELGPANDGRSKSFIFSAFQVYAPLAWSRW